MRSLTGGGMTFRRKKPEDGWADEVMVRLTTEDQAVLATVGLPGEPKGHTYLRVAREALPPASVVLLYRTAPLFPEWLRQGPMSPVSADERGRHMLRRGFEVQAQQVEVRGLVAANVGGEE